MIDKRLFYIATAIIVVSMLASYSMTTYTTLFFGYSQFHFFIRQTLFGLAAIFIMWILAQFDPDKHAVPFGLGVFFLFFILMLTMHFLPSSIVTAVGGAKRWIKLPFISIAPVEFFKVGFVFFLAWSFSRKFQQTSTHPLWSELKLIVPYLVIFLIAVVSIAIFQNDIGQVMVLGLTLSFMLVFAGRSLKLFFMLISLAAVLFVLFVSISEHRIARIKMWWASAQNYILSYLPGWMAQELKLDDAKESYQIVNSLHAIHHGGILGQGVGNGTLKLGFLSEVHTDFILAGLSEEIGFIGVGLLMFLYILLIHRLFKIAHRNKDTITYLFSVGVAMLIGFSLLINSYGISSILPIKGLAVPMLSYGGSSMLANGMALGMVLMLSKKSRACVSS
ncbi:MULTISPECIES: FtsW/RodA/SpoVE family cell cycle protein [unclassified Nitratiruptor]|uniref:FtsW/RodA/SpoVE family cell cycle protein n=1 Tax=unclassified Nitratiruptor TaxID=2624044 RepID=UPI001916BC31|nr:MULTISPECIES: FtsW/RodA/SpoVE family cell cycle protein [unclassified Nitratiruptor]BCD60833.1 cell division protein FtsW [Nitratiruptor sp. YY08-10]BCD64765.1 cell division protein FtsW [Nitratiruptor sp. YY08-14]